LTAYKLICHNDLHHHISRSACHPGVSRLSRCTYPDPDNRSLAAGTGEVIKKIVVDIASAGVKANM
jgi:hypothetical protein